jgi:plastocyanin
MFAAFLSALPLIAVAVAAATYEPKVHEVTLGGAPPNEISYVPNNVYAEPGDIIRFVFKQKNHTVTLTSFEDVCKPLLNAVGQPIFDSGFKPVAPEQVDHFPTIDFAVQNKDPRFFYCQQTRHCGQGMFGPTPDSRERLLIIF